MLAGSVEHGDSLGNHGKLGAGDVQWMTAGSGIMHQEMPAGDAKGRMHGFQLWANLPSRLKMTKPRYQDVPSAAIPEITDDDGTTVRVICGEFWGKTGPVDGVAAEPRYLDVSVPAGKTKRLKVEDYRQAFAYVFEGSADFADASEPFGVLREVEANGQDVLVRDRVGNRSLVVFGAGDEIVVRAGEEGVRFLLVSGRPLREPIAWHGPIVMNTDAEIRQAMHGSARRVVHQELTSSASMRSGSPQGWPRLASARRTDHARHHVVAHDEAVPERAHDMEREQDEQDGPHHQMMQARELGPHKEGGEAHERAQDEVEVEPDMDGAGQVLQGGVLPGRRRRPDGMTKREPPNHEDENEDADGEVSGPPFVRNVGRASAMGGVEQVRHEVAGEPLVGDQQEDEPVKPDLPRAVTD